MNYITEINEFYDWLETNPLPKSAIALWHALMHIANKARWQERFTVAMSTAEGKTAFKRSELKDARNILQQKGRILWFERGGSASAEYQIVPFCGRIAAANPPQIRHKSATNPPQTPPINKLNNTKQNETSFTPAVPEPVEGKNLLVVKTAEQPKKKVAPKKKDEPRPYWQAVVTVWHGFYSAKKDGEVYEMLPKDYEHLSGIYDLLRKRAERKGSEWTQAYMLEVFGYFAEKAWSKKWLPDNFSLYNLLNQFNQIINSDGKNKQPTINNQAVGSRGQRSSNNAAALLNDILEEHSGLPG